MSVPRAGRQYGPGRGWRRLVIDGLSGFLESAVYQERINRFFSCLVNELRSRHVTVFMTLTVSYIQLGIYASVPVGFSTMLWARSWVRRCTGLLLEVFIAVTL